MEVSLTHLDLFAGIGGFTLAAKSVWPDIQTVAFVEWDPFCQKVLAKHFKGVPIHGDIKTYHYTGEPVDLVTAGVPCQPASSAGKRRGTKDHRWLWEEALRVVKDARPRWCIFENPTGILSLQGGVPFEGVLSALETLGYEIETFIIPAGAKGAPHRRDRVWVVANSTTSRRGKQWEERAFESVDVVSDCRWAVEPTMDRVAHGVSRKLDRVARIKSLGNSIVPQVAAEIFKAIQESDSMTFPSETR
jgi:DNA (cytosine-5)-methyltransferase 1